MSSINDPSVRKQLLACASNQIECRATVTGLVQAVQETSGGDVSTEPAIEAQKITITDVHGVAQ